MRQQQQRSMSCVLCCKGTACVTLCRVSEHRGGANSPAASARGSLHLPSLLSAPPAPQVNAAANFPITAVQFGANRLLGQLYEQALGRRPDTAGRVGVAMGAGGEGVAAPAGPGLAYEEGTCGQGCPVLHSGGSPAAHSCNRLLSPVGRWHSMEARWRSWKPPARQAKLSTQAAPCAPCLPCPGPAPAPAAAASALLSCPAEFLVIQQQRSGRGLREEAGHVVRTWGLLKPYKGLVGALCVCSVFVAVEAIQGPWWVHYNVFAPVFLRPGLVGALPCVCSCVSEAWADGSAAQAAQGPGGCCATLVLRQPLVRLEAGQAYSAAGAGQGPSGSSAGAFPCAHALLPPGSRDAPYLPRPWSFAALPPPSPPAPRSLQPPTLTSASCRPPSGPSSPCPRSPPWRAAGSTPPAT